MISGSEIRPGRAASNLHAPMVARGWTVVASNIGVWGHRAALANGVLAHADETDDSHARLARTRSSVIPAALLRRAVWNFRETLLRAVTLGYDVGTR